MRLVEGLDHAVGVKGGQHQVASEGGLDGDAGHLFVAHLAHEDHVRVLAQDGAEGRGEGDPALSFDLHVVDAGDGGFYRVFHGDDVGLGFVDEVEHGVQGGGLSAARRTGHQHQALG